MKDIIWANGQWVAVGTSYILVSSDARTWTSVYHSALGVLETVTWSGSFFVAAGANCIVTSRDGINWTLRSVPFTWYVSVAANDTLAVVIAKNGMLSVSSDLENWVDKKIADSSIINSVLWHPNIPFVLNGVTVSGGSFLLAGGTTLGSFCRTAQGDTALFNGSSILVKGLVRWGDDALLVGNSSLGFWSDTSLHGTSFDAAGADIIGDRVVMVGISGSAATLDLHKAKLGSFDPPRYATGTGALFRSIACNENGCVAVAYSGWVVATPRDRPVK